MTDLLERILHRDASLWPQGNVSANRLGWLDVVGELAEEAKELRHWADSIDRSRVVLLGMGGSSLGPEVLRAAQDDSDGLLVLDTTDPKTLADANLDGAFFLVSSKSGTTLEPNVLFAHAWDRVPDASRFAAITDPGTALDKLATEKGFARVFRNRPDIGGRYSVLSYFGMVPAAFLQYDLAEFLHRARDVDKEDGVRIGVEMGEAAREGRDKATLKVPPGTFRALGLWLEQLIAESTGKQGTGCVPVPTTEVEEGSDRAEFAIHIGEQLDLGAEFVRWEIATAIAGHILGIDPFDEPNVTESKENTKRVLEKLPLPDVPASSPDQLLPWLTEQREQGDYVSIQAYLPYGQDEQLEKLRRKVRDRLDGIATTAGYGPRFLHSTGQLHKGGPNSVLAVQIVPTRPTADLPIPGYPYDFGTLIAAQAIGDYQSLQSHGRRVLRIAADSIQEVLSA
jgi:hypothetical protein